MYSQPKIPYENCWKIFCKKKIAQIDCCRQIKWLDTNRLSPLIWEDLQLASQLKKRTRESLVADLPKQRRVSHAQFRPFSHLKLLEQMRSNRRVGEVFFRPSETRNNALSLYMTTCSSPFKFKAFPIKESGDQVDASKAVSQPL